MPVCGCSGGAGCVREIEVCGKLLRISQRWHPEDRQADVVDHRPPPGLGTCVWEGALALLRALELSPSLVRGKSVLELGCGTGVVALACATLGARRVVATDHDDEVLELCRENVAAHEALATRIDVRPYAWGSGAEAHSALGGPFDVVIGADITYDARAMVHLKEDIHSLTEPEAGRLVLAFARRAEYRPEVLLRSLEDLGSWRVLWPLATVALEERDAPTKVLARWVPLGLVVAHAVRRTKTSTGGGAGMRKALDRASQGKNSHDEPTQMRRRGVVRKWATTDFDSGEVIAATASMNSMGASTSSSKVEGSDTKVLALGDCDHAQPAIPEID